ncbi:hypothetical protein LTR70_010563 [Exophiala xenobiotica]|uniref:Protein kinase domain-containing protein n=1 Tax=Lithohypha guttulata TaxID=1690604 RepID=A0ABR0JTK3_9EURO|nr:hypothetical protein LTR24_010550 [Lithohypha guttulata]KAK5309142.1 hypothetical protein LTR70_010563 [Exophiala xenobiotica]
MYGSDVFAVITAHDQKNKASSALELEHNSRWFSKATGGVALEPTMDSRETTPAEDSQSDHEKEEEIASNVNRLVVSFSKLLALENLENGLQLGTNPILSHILLGHRGTKGISGRQCNITVDETLNIWLHDYHSTHGTAVGQNGLNQKEVRRKETSLAIRIEFPNHRAGTPRYVENLRAFVKKCQGAAKRSKVDPPGIEALGLDSEPSTQAPSEAPTPRDRLVYYVVKKVGVGSFGKVLKIIKARDGKALAAKIFNPPPNRNKRRRNDPDPDWLMKIRREFAIMRDNPHPNVVQVFELRETPEPAIIMDYYPLGNITDANTAYEEYVSAWGQILDGLKHLHAKGVVHRDLKPENILVERNPLFKVIIADFGMAKVATDTALLQTFCGTLKYAAPEVFPGLSSGHGPLVDIFSLGVMVYEWIYGLPKPPNAPALRKKNEEVSDKQWYTWLDEWVGLLLDKLEDEEDDPAIQILVCMIETKVTSRWSATKCLAQGFKSGLFKRRVADGLIGCASDPDDFDLPTGERQDLGTKTPTAAPSLSPGLGFTESAVTTIDGAMWDEESMVRLG